MIKKILPILFASFFFSFHLALVGYVNSSMLGQVVSADAVSVIFMISSALSLLLVFYAPHLVKRYGNVRYMSIVLSASAALLLVLSMLGTTLAVIPVFIVYFALNSMIYYGLDVFLERFTKLGSTGNTRGLYLMLGNLAWVGAPALVGFITARSGFSMVYLIAAAAVCAVLGIILTRERGFHDAHYGSTSLHHVMRTFRNSDLRDIVILQGMLQFFFVWMVIYTPLYLSQTLGFGWTTIGTILSVMLLPFIIFGYPTGRFVDRHHNEREVIFAGFLIIAVATLVYSQLGAVSAISFALILFLTRVGASVAEVSIESYFFKKVKPDDLEVISVYRNMMPIAYIIAPAIAVIVLQFGSYQTLFAMLGVIMSFTALFALFLHDIKVQK